MLSSFTREFLQFHRANVCIRMSCVLCTAQGKHPSYTEQRSLEYDTVSDANVSFISTEILPLVCELHGVSLTTDPARRVAAGGSSGGIGAFCMAWFRPDLFGAVISHIGSYVNIRGGHNFPWLVRNTTRKPIRYVKTVLFSHLYI